MNYFNNNDQHFHGIDELHDDLQKCILKLEGIVAILKDQDERLDYVEQELNDIKNNQ